MDYVTSITPSPSLNKDYFVRNQLYYREAVRKANRTNGLLIIALRALQAILHNS